MLTETSDSIVLQDATALDLELEVAGIGSRSYAFIVDWHIRLLLALLWGGVYLLLAKAGLTAALSPTAQALLGFGPALVLYFLYHPVLEVGWSGWTPGKRIAGVKIVRHDGLPASVGAHLLRNVFRLIDSMPMCYALGLTVAMFHPRQLRIGDIAAGTVLVFEPHARRDALQQARAGMQSQRLTARQHELALDLLARWKSLEDQRRIVLAKRFFDLIGEPLPEHPRPHHREKAILQRLRELTAH